MTVEFPKKKKRESRSWSKTLALVLVIMVAGGGLVYFAVLRPAADAFKLGEDFEQTGDDARSSIEQVTGGQLPETASGLAFKGVSWMDYAYWIRFSLAASDFDAWLNKAENLCFAPLEANGLRGISGTKSDLSWWTPDAAQTYLSAEQCQNSSNAFYSILVDTTDAQTWTVYVSVFST